MRAKSRVLRDVVITSSTHRQGVRSWRGWEECKVLVQEDWGQNLAGYKLGFLVVSCCVYIQNWSKCRCNAGVSPWKFC